MPRVIFLHALGADRLSWVATTPALEAAWATANRRGDALRLEALDLPGHGAALDAIGDGTLDDLAAQVAARIGAGPVWIVGHSLGGGIALRLAAQQPDLVAGLVLLAPLGLAERLDLDRLNTYPAIDDTDSMAAFLRHLVTEPALIAPPFVTYALDQLRRPGARAALSAILRAIPAAVETLAPDIDDLPGRMPITTIWGQDDPIARPDLARARALGPFHPLPGLGHIPHVEGMAHVNRLLVETILGPP